MSFTTLSPISRVPSVIFFKASDHA